MQGELVRLTLRTELWSPRLVVSCVQFVEVVSKNILTHVFVEECKVCRANQRVGPACYQKKDKRGLE